MPTKDISNLAHDTDSEIEMTEAEVPVADKTVVVGALNKLSVGLRMHIEATDKLTSLNEGTPTSFTLWSPRCNILLTKKLKGGRHRGKHSCCSKRKTTKTTCRQPYTQQHPGPEIPDPKDQNLSIMNREKLCKLTKSLNNVRPHPPKVNVFTGPPIKPKRYLKKYLFPIEVEGHNPLSLFTHKIIT